MKRAIAWLLCLVLLCGCAAAPAEEPEAVPAGNGTEVPEQNDNDEVLTDTQEEPSGEELDAPEERRTAADVPGKPEEDAAATSAEPEPTPPIAAEKPVPSVGIPSQKPESAAPATSVPSTPAVQEPADPTEPPTPPDTVGTGLWETADGLYYVQEDGTCLVNDSVGYLTFGADGRYTSGSADLDVGIDNLIAKVCPDLTVSSESRLRLLYDHIRDNYRYLSMEHYAAGTTDWGNTAALTMLNQGKGNCYNFTALFTACARRLGYQAYNVAGHEWSTTNDHAWTMIAWSDGVTYLFDVQLEYAYLYMYANKPKIDMFKASGGNGSYNGFAYYFP